MVRASEWSSTCATQERPPGGRNSATLGEAQTFRGPDDDAYGEFVKQTIARMLESVGPGRATDWQRPE